MRRTRLWCSTKLPTPPVAIVVGVCVYALHGQPSIPYANLSYALASIHGAVNPNTVRFRAPSSVRGRNWHEAHTSIQAQFAIDFPAASLPDVVLSAPRPGFGYIDVSMRYDEVRAEEMAKVASKWRVNGEVLGEAQFTGLATGELLHVIRFDKIPHSDLQAFIDFLPQLFRTLAPAHAITVVDIWKLEYKLTFNSPHQQSTHWTFGNSLIVLFSLSTADKAEVQVADIVLSWPGWWMWNGVAVGMVYPGRYDYCTFCKYTAQMLEGTKARRHTTAMCKKLICMKCGKVGHYDTTCKTAFGGRK
ncbi:uncharacterized protein SRS1_16394 [Sporisorium reilianum f. sp. reilianum]|uniref:CCHC-type domain-containing protein n=1 Tax=Sporisorium reilianum f. sp. reilianum TaxID=72559 RepID=A0A2N8ULW5_9BASI|nr:uncharacterized protein SRS1_16394 [Sporisorium reilianum f. sp. reilianum]